MKKLLWVGDAAVATGFARYTHHVLDVLRGTWDVHVLGLNYVGDPHEYPYPIYPCWPGGDAFGLGRLEELLPKIKPDVVIVLNDPWNIPEYLGRAKDTPVIATMPVDGKNCRGDGLNGLAGAIFWTRFGLEEAVQGGFKGPARVVPLGVDTALYTPLDHLEARKKMTLPEFTWNSFIVGNVNRNQPRKRLDLTIEYFAGWYRQYQHQDTYLFLHVAPTGESSYDVLQLMRYYGFRGDQKRLILAEPDIGHGVPEQVLPAVYSCFDVQLTTTQGEGWGLTTMEGMACGVPQVVPEWSALAEWPEKAVYGVPCTARAVTPNRINVVGGVADGEKVVEALEHLYQDADLRSCYGRLGRELVSRPEFRWPDIGARFSQALDEMLKAA